MKKGLFIFLISFIFYNFCLSQEWTDAEIRMKNSLAAGRYDSSLYYADEAAAIMRGTIGENNLQYGFMMRYMAYTHFYLGNYRKAKYFILKEEGLWESLRKTRDPEYINCLTAASVICRKTGAYEEALTLVKKAEKKTLELFKPDSPQYADILVYYTGAYHDLGNSVSDIIYLNQEEKYLERAGAIYQNSGDRFIREIIHNKSDLAALNNNTGNIPVATNLLREVADLCKKEYGEKSPGYGSVLNNLGVLNYNSGNYKQAEKYFMESLEIFKNYFPDERNHTGVCLNNLGVLYHQIGNFEIAEKLTAEAAGMFEKGNQAENPQYSVILSNQACVSISEEYYSNPENKNAGRIEFSGNNLKKAETVFNMNCQKPHPFMTSITGNLAVWYYLKGEDKKASQMMNEMALESFSNSRLVMAMNKMTGSARLPASPVPDHGPEPVIIPITIDLLYQITNTSTESLTNEMQGLTNAIARLALGKAVNLKKAVGPYHPAYGSMIKSLFISYGLMNDVKSEEELRLEYINVLNQRTLQDFSFLSETEKEMYYQTRLPEIHSFIAYSLDRKKGNPSITTHTYNNILLSKGLMLKSSTAMRVAILNSNNAELLKEYDEWIELQKEISVLYSTPVEMRTKDLAQLEQKSVELERSLVSRSQDFSDFRKGIQVTWEDVRKSLKQDEAAIEFTDFRRLVKDGGQSVIYAALIVRPNSEYPEMVKLFNEEQLIAVISQGGANNLNNINNIYGTMSARQEKLYNLIWKPIEPYIEGVKTVIISPSGLLNKISFPAIGDGKGVYLCDRYRIQLKGSSGNLTSQNLFDQGNKASALVFGGVQYSSSNTGSDVWSYLEGTKEEGDVISGILRKALVEVNYLSGITATETFFKENAGRYNMMHLATHGFFFDDPNKVRFEEKKEEVEYGDITFRGASSAYGINSFVNNENPLMRSGLVLAGANDVWVKSEKSGPDDGVLTAQEVAQIDMRKSNLVVLSACETGLGDIKGTEGVYGLQRALKMAGVRYLIISLWEIPDKETVEFMESFYSNLLEFKDIREAFYSAQKRMRSKYDPYFWGAFVLME